MNVPVFTCPKCKSPKMYLWDGNYNHARNIKSIAHLSCVSCDYNLYVDHLEVV